MGRASPLRIISTPDKKVVLTAPPIPGISTPSLPSAFWISPPRFISVLLYFVLSIAYPLATKELFVTVFPKSNFVGKKSIEYSKKIDKHI
jgi:hypothetical protein